MENQAKTMKAAVYSSYGPPEIVRLEEILCPTPKAGEVLVKVMFSSVNRTDCGFRSAEYFISRFWSGLWKPNFSVLGCEFSGIVEEVGQGVSQFKKGDRVFGFNDQTFGGHAEFLIQKENDAIALIPEGVSFETAAVLTEGAHYALVDIKASGIVSGQKALVYGATGAIGSAAIQILKSMNVFVVAVVNSKNYQTIQNLGVVDELWDYQTRDFTQTQHRFNLVLDAVGKSSFGVCKKLMTENGIYISTELGKNWENVWLPMLKPFMKGPRVMFPMPSITKSDVEFLGELASQGFLKPLVDRSYPLDQIVEAYRYVETGQKLGNVLLKIN